VSVLTRDGSESSNLVGQKRCGAVGDFFGDYFRVAPFYQNHNRFLDYLGAGQKRIESHAEYPPEPVLRLCVQCTGRPDRSWDPLPVFRNSAESDDCGRGDGIQLPVSRIECVKTEPGETVKSG